MSASESTSRRLGTPHVIVVVLVLTLAAAGFEALTESAAVSDLGPLAPLRVLLGAVLALFVPGYLILCLARIEVRRPTRTLVYVLGLSCAFLLLVTLLTNLLLGPAGVDLQRPFDAVQPVFLVGILLLGVVVLFRSDRDRSRWRPDAVAPRTVLWILLFCLLPLVSVAGTRLLNSGQNTLALGVVVLVALVPVSIGTGVVPRELHPVAIWSVSLSVLLGMTMITDHIWGWDIHFQYATARDVLDTGLWGPGVGVPSNSLLSTTLLAAAFSSVTGFELVWVYKLIYPVLGSALPVIVYHLSDSVFDDYRIAGLGPFALIFYYGFFKFFPDKQIISLLFFAFTLLALFDDGTSGIQKRAVTLTFAALTIVSHYGVSMLALSFLGLTALAIALAQHAGVVEDRTDILRPTFLVFFAVLWYVWFRYSADGTNLVRIVEVGYETIAEFSSGGSSSRSGSGYATRALESPLWAVYTLLNLALLGFVSLGVVRSLVTIGSRERLKSSLYVTLAAVVYGFLVSSVVAIYGMGFDRTMLIAMVVLAPFALIGLRTIIHVPLRYIRGERAPSSRERTTAFLGIFFAVFFLFSSGFTFVVAGDTVPPYSINVDDEAEWHTYQESEIDATRWFERYGSSERAVAVFNEGETLKSRDGFLMVEVVSSGRIRLAWPSRTEFREGGYIYVSEQPMASETENIERTYIEPETTAFYRTQVVSSNEVYDSGSASIFSTRRSEGIENVIAEPGPNTGDQRE